MKVVVIGARRRSEAEDEVVVNRVCDELLDKYPNIRIVSGSCDRSIGKLVKTKCLPETGTGKSNAQFPFLENHIRPYNPRHLPDLTPAEYADVFLARNPFFDEYGEEFHLFVDEEGPRGLMADLVRRLKARNAPTALYRPGEKDYKEAGNNYE